MNNRVQFIRNLSYWAVPCPFPTFISFIKHFFSLVCSHFHGCCSNWSTLDQVLNSNYAQEKTEFSMAHHLMGIIHTDQNQTLPKKRNNNRRRNIVQSLQLIRYLISGPVTVGMNESLSTRAEYKTK